MKKLIAIILALTMVLSLAACGGKEDKGSTNDGGAASTSATKVTVFWYDEADIYLGSVREALN